MVSHSLMRLTDTKERGAKVERRIIAQTAAEGDESLPFRLYAIARGEGMTQQTEYRYIATVDEAVRLVADEGWGDGYNVAGLEEHFPDGEWGEFYDDRGCDLDELVEEYHERDGAETIQDVLNRI